jgi:hypothetical protein
MADAVQIGDGEYIPSKRAAQISGYSQDYIGQLCRAGLIEAKRIGGLWHVALDSLYKHKQKADSYVPVAPRKEREPEADSVVTFEGKDYVSASRAAELTGYHKDYVGQLARKGSIQSRQIGNRWYVHSEGILAHKTQKDALLAAVQAESVGLRTPTQNTAPAHVETPIFYQYTRDDGALLPAVKALSDAPVREHMREDTSAQAPATRVPIRVVLPQEIFATLDRGVPEKIARSARRWSKSTGLATASVVALTIVVIAAVGYGTAAKDALYTLKVPTDLSTERFTANASATADKIASFLERMVVTELRYERAKAF